MRALAAPLSAGSAGAALPWIPLDETAGTQVSGGSGLVSGASANLSTFGRKRCPTAPLIRFLYSCGCRVFRTQQGLPVAPSRRVTRDALVVLTFLAGCPAKRHHTCGGAPQGGRGPARPGLSLRGVSGAAGGAQLQEAGPAVPHGHAPALRLGRGQRGGAGAHPPPRRRHGRAVSLGRMRDESSSAFGPVCDRGTEVQAGWRGQS